MTQILTSISALLPIMILAFVLLNWKSNKTRLAIQIGKVLLSAGVIASISLLLLSYFNNHNLSTAFSGLLRFDSLSTIMFLMVSLIGFIVLRFSTSYLHGDTNHLRFIHKLLLTIAFVQLLVLSGNLFTLLLFWVATSFSLQGLILFYKERKEAQQAVKKKFLVARMSDLSLLAGVLFLYFEFGTADMETIFQGLKDLSIGQLTWNIELSGFFIVLAAIIKSVQIPFHGWILDVMEAPTPVSALLHAGLLNAGPFLIIRFSYLMEWTTLAPIILIAVGGISALYGTIVFPSQPAVKTGLAYSSIGHMGFSLMICGMGFYSAALLHIIAHSFYKAHSFLSSGSAIDKYRLNQLKGNNEFKARTGQLVVGILVTGSLFLAIVNWMGQHQFRNFQMIVLGTIIIAGVSSFMGQSVTVKNGYINIAKAVLASGVVLLAFFIFESFIGTILGSQIPTLTDPSITIKVISLALLMGFVVTLFLSISKTSQENQATSKWLVYRRNGFYIHVLFDHMVNAFTSKIANQKL